MKLSFSLSLSLLSFSFLLLNAVPSRVLAQNPGVVMVNKTNCTIEVYAECGSCPDAGISVSPVYFIPPYSHLLFSEQGGNGCDGAFMYFKISLPATGGSIGYQGAFSDIFCDPSESCGTLNTIDLVLQSDHPCLQSDARISGEYHANPSAGSNCHIVIQEQ